MRFCTFLPALLLTALTALPSTAAAASAGASKSRPPNVVLIQADDLGWSDLGCYGNRFIQTPAIDGLARQGMRFTNAYSGAPICTPARAALITGLHAARLHITGQPGYKTEDTRDRQFAHPDFRTALPPDAPSIAKTLQPAGYTSFCVGKWGLDNPPESMGFTLVNAPDDDALAQAAVAVLRENRDRPFFLYFNPTRPHVPLRPPADLLAKYQEKKDGTAPLPNPAYAAEIEAFDRTVGVILAALDQLELAAHTVVIVSSDNGGFLGTKEDPVTSNAPLREGKASLYEGGIRVPLIVRWPGVVTADTHAVVPVHGVDLHPTLAEIAGPAARPPLRLDGRSLVPVLQHAPGFPSRPLFWHYPHYRRALAGMSASPSSAVRDGEWKLIHFYADDHVELYNLRLDPRESRNVAPALPAQALTLRHALDMWRRDVGAQPPVPQPNAPQPASETRR